MTDLKIEAGKCYETKSEGPVYLGYKNDKGYFVGHSINTGTAYTWNSQGLASTSGLDLISEWKEPRKGEVWVNVYAETDGAMCLFAHDSREEADGHSDDEERFACIGPFSWTEGQGLDGEGSE